MAVLISQNYEFASVGESFGYVVTLSLGGSVISGLICGFLLVRWRGRKGFDFISETIAFSILMAIVSFGICCVGCVAVSVIYEAINK